MNYNDETAELQQFLLEQRQVEESFSLGSTAHGYPTEDLLGTGTGIAAETGAIPSASATRGTTTEFTRRKNWSQRLIEELKDFYHVISLNGKLIYCSPSSTELVGYSPEELVGRNITDFIHVDDVDMFVRDFNLAITQRSTFMLYYRFRKKDDKFVVLEVNGHPYFGEGQDGPFKCFFSMGRAYPGKTTAMLDSFLELKVENENLRRQLRELTGPPEAAAATSVASNAERSVEDLFNVPDSNGSLLEKLTGLRYQEGERARGISTGTANPALFNENLMDVDEASGAALARDESHAGQGGVGRDALTSSAASPPRQRKKKKPKVDEEEYVCTECGTVESPEWRKGPQGPKTLCNACGLRWAKKTKRQASTGASTSSNIMAASAASGTIGGIDHGTMENRDY